MTADRPLVAVLDYGIGNLRSAQKALERMGADARLTADRGVIADAAGVVLPGVGAFGACAAALRTAGLEDVALDAVASGRPFLGICVGMQLLFERSEEDDAATGLGVIPGSRALDPARCEAARRCSGTRCSCNDRTIRLFAGLGAEPWMYFVHSLHAVPDDAASVAATCEYGTELTAAIRQGNVFATQFHPEKSGTAGLELLANFTAWPPGSSAPERPAMIELYPAIDVRGGRCVRLHQGDYQQETVYSDDPVAVALGFAAAGARWIHVVDLDAARSGEPENRAVVGAIASAVGAQGVQVQSGGGVRSEAAAAALADAGVARVVIGTAAMEDPALVARIARRQPAAVGLDGRGGEVAVRGLARGERGLRARRAAPLRGRRRRRGDRHRDRPRRHARRSRPRWPGRGPGPHEPPADRVGRRRHARRPPRPGRPRGGERRLAGAIAGKAIYEGRFTVAQALAALAG